MDGPSALQTGYFFLKTHDFSSAEIKFNEALNEAETADGCIGLLLAQNQKQSEEQLPEIDRVLAEEPLFARALELSDVQRRAVLHGYAAQQKTLLDGKEEKYRQLLSLEAGADTPAACDGCLALCTELAGYKDAEQIDRRVRSRKAELEKKKKKRLLAVLIPCAVLVIAAFIVLLFTVFLPKRGQVRYALTLNGYIAVSCDEDAKNVELESAIYGVGVSGIGKKAFKDCADLQSVTLRSDGIRIERAAFNGCAKLKTLVGSEKVTFVEENAFKDCTALRELRFSEGCVIDKNAFRGCDEDLKVYVGDRRWERA